MLRVREGDAQEVAGGKGGCRVSPSLTAGREAGAAARRGGLVASPAAGGRAGPGHGGAGRGGQDRRRDRRGAPGGGRGTDAGGGPGGRSRGLAAEPDRGTQPGGAGTGPEGAGYPPPPAAPR